MDDQRNLTMGVQFGLTDSISQLSNVLDMIQDIKAGFLGAERGASNFGSEAASSAGMMADELESARRQSERVSDAMMEISDAGDDVRRSARSAGGEFDRLGDAADSNADRAARELRDARDAAEELGSEAARSAGAMSESMDRVTDAVEDTTDSLDDLGDAGDDVGNTYRNIGAEANSFKEAIANSSNAAIKQTNSLTKTIKAGFQGAYGYAGKQVSTFGTKIKSGAEDVKQAFTHPIQTIKGKLSDALDRASAGIDDTGDEADKTGDDLKKMGHDGESAGTKIKDAVGGAVKSFFAISAAIEIVKAGIEVAKQFGTAVMNAGIEAEQTGAKFEASFAADSGVQEWAENFSSAIHRSKTEVQGFLVSNKAMYNDLGITGEAANQLSEITTSLAYDLGSAFKMDDAEALNVMQDYINGNTSALSEYGIQINDTVLKQTAMEMGLGSNIDSLNDAAMAQVRMNALLQNSTEIQQAAAKKQEGYTNSIKSLKGVWNDFLSGAAERFAPVFTELTNTIMTSWPQIEPALMGMIDMLSNGFAAGAPVIMDLATGALPGLISTLGELMTAAAPIGGVLLDMATTALPPLAAAVTPLISTFGTLAQTILPPVSRIISSIATTVVPPLVSILKSLSENVIAPLMPHVESIANAILPALSAGLKVIPPILSAISPVLSGIAGVLSTVVGFLSKIMEWAANGLANLLDKVAGIFGGGSKAASSAGADIPHNADGDNNFAGGWTHINERGGEIAYLPSGSTIIPADKSEQIIKGSQQQNVSVSAPFTPVVNIDIHGNVDPGTAASLKDEIKQTMRELYQEFKNEDAMNMAIQQGNA
ncbi:hypothetical protein NQ487_19830 [Hungatella hathewayi]|nr:hypothetical protein [Hungatella hathewayi]UWO83120.1 hypothetical protein NQ487_19830 [Hungatella hathewayi]